MRMEVAQSDWHDTNIEVGVIGHRTQRHDNDTRFERQ